MMYIVLHKLVRRSPTSMLSGDTGLDGDHRFEVMDVDVLSSHEVGVN